MSNYTLAVSWSGKDELPDGAAAKIISGDDFHTEFTTAKAAINSKADIESPTLTGIPISTAITDTTTNTNQIATTAFIQLIKESLRPVGSIFTTTSDDAAPATTSAEVTTLLGFGVWEAFGQGRVLVGKASSGTFDTAEDEGGFETHTLTESEMPSHDHKTNIGFEEYYGNQIFIDNSKKYDLGTDTTAEVEVSGSDSGMSTRTGDAGSDSAHNNLQPYIVVYMWKRTE